MTASCPPATIWPRVSVIIPTYNRAGMVRAAIDSALSQNYPDFEVLVIDDGSTDGTAAGIQRWGVPVNYIRQANAGAASARNTGIRLATGELVAFLDSDDLFLPGKLRAQVEYFLARPTTVLVYCWYSIVDEAGRTRLGRRCRLTGDVADELLSQSMHGPLATPTVMVRRSALLETGGFDEKMRLSEDTDLWCRLARLGPVGCVPQELVEVRRHSGNLSGGPGRRRFLEAALRILEKSFAANPALTPTLHRRLLIKAHLWSWLVALGGALPANLSFWLRGMLTNPHATAARWIRGHSAQKPGSQKSVVIERRRAA